MFRLGAKAMRAARRGVAYWKARFAREPGHAFRGAPVQTSETILLPEQVAFVRESNVVMVLSALFVLANVVTSTVYLARFL